MAILHYGRRSGQVRAGVMKSVVIKRSILINGRRTSVSLENEFWEGLHEIADRGMIAHSRLVEQIDQERDNINLSSAIRVFVFNYFRTPGGVKPAGNFKVASDYGLLAERLAPRKELED